ncbi:MAG TPA: DUF1684 domain-containing protein [Caulobacterales bacterium]|nr:DUF1684 domain-containing protein [Caulobacterales bacterium]
MRSGWVAALCLAWAMPVLAQPAVTMSPEQAWEREIDDANAAWATDKYAILKIDDAVYLKPGETAWLVAPRPPAGKTAWRLDAASDPLLVVTYTKNEAVFVRDGKTVSFDPRDGVEVAVDSTHEVRAELTQVSPGETGLRIFSYDQDNPAAKAFKGVSYFPYAASYVITAAFAAEPPKPVDFQTSRGWYKRFWRVGSARFRVRGRAVSLPLYAEGPNGEGGLSAFFLDKTTGKETYQPGRYLDAGGEGAFPPKTVTLDFNYAYNPNCARSPHFNCPYATDSLPVAIEAGEKAPDEPAE